MSILIDWEIISKIFWSFILYIIGSIFTVATLVWVVRMWRGWTKYKKAVKFDHSKELFKDLQNPVVKLNPYLKDGLKLEVEPYPDEIIEHLKDDAYKDKKAKENRNISVIEIIETRDFYIDKLHNEELRILYSDLQKEILDPIKQRNFIKCDTSRSTDGQINFFNKETIELDILRVIIASYPDAPKSLSFQIRSYDNFKEFFCINTSNPWIISDTKHEKKLKELDNLLPTIFDDAIKRKFGLIVWYYNEINEFQICISEKLKQIHESTKSTFLKGKCKKCPKEDSLWRYTWQRIDKYLQ
jgi:hypothetical protein